MPLVTIIKPDCNFNDSQLDQQLHGLFPDNFPRDRSRIFFYFRENILTFLEFTR